MKTVVVGCTGLIGSKTVAILRSGDNEVVAASLRRGNGTSIPRGTHLSAIVSKAVFGSNPELVFRFTETRLCCQSPRDLRNQSDAILSQSLAPGFRRPICERATRVVRV
jgi:hypothetical protein